MSKYTAKNKPAFSNCCHALVTIGGEGTTHYFVCRKCGKPCDIASDNKKGAKMNEPDWPETLLPNQSHSQLGTNQSYNESWNKAIDACIQAFQKWQKVKNETK